MSRCEPVWQARRWGTQREQVSRDLASSVFPVALTLCALRYVEISPLFIHSFVFNMPVILSISTETSWKRQNDRDRKQICSCQGLRVRNVRGNGKYFHAMGLLQILSVVIGYITVSICQKLQNWVLKG